MEPEELERLVKEGPTSLLVERLAPLGKTERSRLSKTARALQRAHWKSYELPSCRPPSVEEAERIALAQLGVCPTSSLRDFYWVRDDATTVAVLRHRDREMLDALLDKTLDGESPWISWGALRELVRLGACSKPTSEGYVRSMLPRCNVYAHREPHIPLSEKLLAEPDLLEEDFWRLFEVENHAFAHESSSEEATEKGYETWRHAVVKLSAAGHLDRQRLLSATLSALWISDNRNVIRGYRKLHEALKPTLDESAARLDAYAELLSHRTPDVVGFALKQITRVVKKREIPAESLLEQLRPVFSFPQKGHAVNATKLIALLLDDAEADLDRVSEVLMEALLHPHADVQAAALDVLESQGERLSDATRSGLAELGAEISPLVKHRLGALVGHALGALSGGREPPAEDDVGDLLARLAALSAPVRHRLSLPDHADRATVEETLPPARSLDFRNLADLSHYAPVLPIADVDELIDAVAHAIEVVDSATELERILDGISRLCDQTGAEFHKRTAPLLHRIKQGGEGRGLAAWHSLPALADLVCTWIEGVHYVTPMAKGMTMHGPVRFQRLRLRELAVRVQQRTASPLLSAPTHDGGWVDPRALVARAAAVRDAGQSPLETDIVQALLRLAFTGRTEALEAALALPGHMGDVIRHALGGPGPTRKCDAASPLWVAAAKARAPDADAPCAGNLPLPNAGPVAQYTWTPWFRETSAYGNTYRTRHLRIEVTPPFTRKAVTPRGPVRRFFAKLAGVAEEDAAKDDKGGGDALEPTDSYPSALLLDEHELAWTAIGSHTDWGLEWASLSWPLDTDALCAWGIRSMVARVDMDGSKDAPNHVYLKPLFQPGRPWTELAVLSLWVALSSKDADLRAAAIDLLVAGIEDGRADPALLATVLNRVAIPGWVRPNRLADALDQVARVSPLHAAITAELLERHLASLEELPRSGHLYLELLYTLLSTLARPVRPDARLLLESPKGGSKTAKVARALLALKGDARGQREANLMAWRAAIERAASPHRPAP